MASAASAASGRMVPAPPASSASAALVAGDGDDRRAGLGHGSGDPATQAAARADHDRGAVREVVVGSHRGSRTITGMTRWLARVFGKLRKRSAPAPKMRLALLRRLLGDDIERLAPDLDPRVRLRLEIAVPAGMARRSAVRGKDHVAPLVAHVSDGGDPAEARPGAGVVDQQQRRSLEHAADAPFVGAELVDHLGVELCGRGGHGTPMSWVRARIALTSSNTRRRANSSSREPAGAWL